MQGTFSLLIKSFREKCELINMYLNAFFFFGLYSTVGFEVPSIALMKGLISGFMNATQYYCGSCNLLNSQEKTTSKLDHCRHL